MILAEFNPAILFLLLWGLLSWLTKKKENQLKEKDQGEYSEIEPKGNLFARLQKLQDHLSTEMKIFPLDPEPTGVEEEYLAEDDKNTFEGSEILAPNLEEVQADEEFVFETDIKISTKRQTLHLPVLPLSLVQEFQILQKYSYHLQPNIPLLLQ
jgi:hypothetical protein